MKKSAPIALGIIGTLSLQSSAIRPQNSGEAERHLRRHHDWG